jgi:phosphoribosylformylglycinamidine cyclo-ligase
MKIETIVNKKYPVDIEKADRTVNNIKKYSDQIGGFGGVYEWNKNLVASADGIGTKILTAQYAQRRYQRDIATLGIDCVAMVVNDLICKGAKPLFFLDYYASSSIDEWSFYQILDGIHAGCEESGMKLLGGETAELNGVIEQGTFDVCGFGVGEITRELPKNVQKGDAVIGLFSDGIHSNGFSLINKMNLDKYDNQFIDTLLTPTKIYVQEIERLYEYCDIHALAHITGGGLTNIDRVLPEGLSVKYLMSDGYFCHNELFKTIQKDYGVEYEEMRTTFNCGVGMVVIMAPESVKNMPDNEFIILGEIV